MQLVSYAGGSFVTGDAIADAIFTYAATLGNDDRASFLHVPAVDSSGVVTRVRLLIGPASQLMSRPDAQTPELEDPEFVRRTMVEAQKRLSSAGIDPSPLP